MAGWLGICRCQEKVVHLHQKSVSCTLMRRTQSRWKEMYGQSQGVKFD